MNTAAEIYVLMETTGKSAPDITQALKNIGGDMQTGVKKIASYFLEEGRYEGYQIGKQIGERNGLLKGTIIGLAVPALFGTGYYLYDKYKAKIALLAHKADGNEILNGFKASTLAEAEVISSPTVANYSSSIGELSKEGGQTL